MSLASGSPPPPAAPPNPTAASTAARGGALNAAGSIAATVFGFALVMVVTNAYGDVRSGTFFSAVAVFSICGQTTKLGADTGLVFTLPRLRAAGRHGDQARMVVLASVPVLLVSSAVATGLIVGDDALARLLVADADAAERPEFAAIMRGLGWFLPAWALTQVMLGGTRGMGTMKPMAAIQHIGRTGLQLLFVGLAAIVGWTGIALGIAWAAPLGITALAASLWLSRLLGSSVMRADAAGVSAPLGTGSEGLEGAEGSLAEGFWRFSLPRGMSAMFNVTLEKADVVLVQRYSSAADAGVYGATARLINAGYLLAFSVGQAVSPQLSSLFAQGRHAEIKDLYQTVVGWMVAFVWPVYLGFVIMGEPVLGFFGGEFTAGSNALAITSVGMLLMLLLGPGDFLLLMSGRTWQSFANVAVSLALNLALNRALIPSMGLEGAALAWAVGILVAALLPLVQNWRSLGVHPFRTDTLLVAGVAGGIVGGGLLLLRFSFGQGPVVAVVGGAALMCVYGAVIWSMAERLQLDAFVGRFSRRQS